MEFKEILNIPISFFYIVFRPRIFYPCRVSHYNYIWRYIFSYNRGHCNNTIFTYCYTSFNNGSPSNDCSILNYHSNHYFAHRIRIIGKGSSRANENIIPNFRKWWNINRTFYPTVVPNLYIVIHMSK